MRQLVQLVVMLVLQCNRCRCSCFCGFSLFTLLQPVVDGKILDHRLLWNFNCSAAVVRDVLSDFHAAFAYPVPQSRR